MPLSGEGRRLLPSAPLSDGSKGAWDQGHQEVVEALVRQCERRFDVTVARASGEGRFGVEVILEQRC